MENKGHWQQDIPLFHLNVEGENKGLGLALLTQSPSNAPLHHYGFVCGVFGSTV